MKLLNKLSQHQFIQSKRNQLIGLIMLLVSINSVFTLFYFSNEYKKIAIQKAENESKSITELTEFSVFSSLFFMDYYNIDLSLQGVKELKNLKSVIISDLDYNQIYGYRDSSPKTLKRLGIHTDYDNGIISCQLPINYHPSSLNDPIKKHVIGYLEIKFSINELKNEIKNTQKIIAIISMITLVFGIFISLIISKIFTNPLKQLKNIFAEISSTNLQKRAKVVGNNEFSSLASSFNLMVDRLDKAYNEIFEINKSLEERVVERTQSLLSEVEERKNVQNDLLRINQLITGIIHASPLPILSLDTQGNIKSVSPSFTILLGLTIDEVINKLPPFKNMYELEKYFESINAALRTDQSQMFQTVIVANEGQEKNVQIHLSPIKNLDNRCNSVIAIMEDISERISKEIELKESEEKYRLLIDHTRVGIGIFNNGKCIFANDSLANIWCFNNSNEFREIDFVDYITDVSKETLYNIFDIHKSSNTPYELQITKRDGSIGYVEATKTIMNYHGEPLVQIAFLDISERIKAAEEIMILNQELEQRVLERTAMLNDALSELKVEINERKKAEEKLRLSDRILQRVGTLVLVADENSEIIYISPYIKTLLGYEVEDMLGDGWWNITSQNANIREKEREYIKKCANGEITPKEQAYERSVISKSGELKWIQWQDVTGDLNTVIGVGNDITAKTIATQQLKQAGIELEKTLAKERELGELKTRFISMISHEYRTPLTVILSSANIINKLITRNETNKAFDFIKKIEISVQSMVKLLEDVLIIGKSESGTLKAEYSDLNFEYIVNDIVSDLKSAHKYNNPISIDFEGDFSSIQSDEKLLRQIFTNLISNALKYSPNGTPVALSLKKTDDFIKIEIEDQGIGISEEDLKHLFDSFYRGKNVGTISGTGLGMQILKRSVDMLEGSINVSSKVNEGTKFEIILPLKVD